MNRQIPIFLALFLFAATPSGAQTTVFEETFDGVAEPDLPATVESAHDSWATSSSSESGGSGANNLRHGGTTPGDIVFGPIDLQLATSAEITYLARRTSSYPADSLVLAVSADDGATWTTLMGPGAALPETTSEYQTVSTPIPDSIAAGSVVRLRFRGYGGTSSGSNIRIDDLTVTADVDLSGVSDTFGFGAASSTSTGQPVSIAMDLSWTGPDSIQGIQFDVDFDPSLLSMTGVSAGSAVSGPGWTVDHGASGGSARVILLGGAGDVITTGLHPAVVSLEFTPVTGGATSPTITTISIRDLIVSAYDPGGSDLTVVAEPNEHQLTLEYAAPSISLSADSLSLGTADVGTTATGVVTVSNPTGEGDLVVSGVTSGSPLFSASPASFSVPPGGSVDLDISFSPTEVDFGFQSATVSLSHNAASGSSQIVVEATGTGGRGDATADGLVDVGDVVAGIDAVLERIDPVAAAETIDLYPFPVGDGAVDVRDLTVLVHAILNGFWPDAVDLPAADPASAPAGKRAAAAIILTEDAGAGTVLGIETETPLRGIQIDLRGLDAEPDVLFPEPDAPADGSAGPTGGAPSTAASVTRSMFDPDARRFVLLSASSDAVLNATDRIDVRGLPAGFSADDVALAVGVTSNLERLALSVSDRRSANTETPEASRLDVSVFPNPARSGYPAMVRLRRTEAGADAASETSGTWSLRIVDLLGREILSRRFVTSGSEYRLDTSRLPAGLYFIRAGDGDSFRTLPLTIVR